MAGYGISFSARPSRDQNTQPWNISTATGNHYAESTRSTSMIAQYVSGTYVGSTLTLDLDYIRKSGQLSVSVRGVNTLPPAGTLTPGTQAYNNWAQAGTLLFDSGNFTRATSWRGFTATVSTGPGYAFYVVQVAAVGGSTVSSSVKRAVDNVKLLAP